ncbi:hypothetical protein [Paenirhodobacter populi]|uniref:Uncharacterized protein n=1 Tax=Paenirhodobacter populi TaxID=2306993 RepID=A0A443J1B7_9RHOB|nr:hypothetical protein [Sinirhodobacter populi]RWR14257.1 hypothetical protein D2T33_03310 [Sinirhodobacter populi]
MGLLTFPLSVDDFLRRLPIAKITFDLPESVEVSETDGGDLLSADIGTRLWQGDITLGKITRDEDADALTLIDVLRQGGRPFCAFDLRRPGPRADLTGSMLGSAPVQIQALLSNNRQMSLSGLPVGYVLQRGDYLGWDYGTNPIRRALHKVVDVSVTATAQGQTDAFEVTPNIREGATVGSPVRLIRPFCTAIIVPGSVTTGTAAATLTEGASFKWRQTLRY